MIYRPPLWWRLLLPLRISAVPFYRLGLSVHRAVFRAGLKRRYRPPVPVVCVGNLSTGGTGKTPVVISIVRMLQEGGRKVAVLTRGYKAGRKRLETLRVSGRPDRAQVSPRDVGDEPFLIAEKLEGAHILVGPDRSASARLAVEEIGCDVLVMDDGFQHWALERDLDIVLLDASQPRRLNHLIPWGNLREGFGALRRAGVAVIAKARGERERALFAEAVRRRNPSIAIWQADLAPRAVVRLADGAMLELEALRDRSVLLVCGIASPEGFERTALRLGCRVEKRFFYRDHFAYPDLVIRWLELQARRVGVDLLLTTEKDAVKLRGRVSARAPWVALAVEAEWLDPPAERVKGAIEAALSL